MRNSPHRMKHEQKKAIRSAQKKEYEIEESALKEEEVKKHVTSKKTNKSARGKAASKKKSKKASPQDVTWETEPDNIHKEGEHWMKTIQKQTLDAGRRLQKKLQKFMKGK